MGDNEKSFTGNNRPGKSNRNGSANGYYGGEVVPFAQMEDDTDNFDYQRIIEGLLKFKWLILFCTILGGTLAWFFAQSLTPMYQTSGTLFIKDQSGGQFYAGSDLSSMLSRSYGIGIGSPLDNELQLIQSRSFADRIADRLLEKQRMENGEIFPILLDEVAPDGRATKGQIMGRFRFGLTAERVGRDIDIVSLQFESVSPLETAEIVNLAMNEYIILSREQSRAGISSALTFLDTELRQIGQTLEDSEDRLQLFMESENLVKIDEQTSRLINQISTLEAQLETQNIELTAFREGRKNSEQELDAIRPGFADQVNEAIAPRLTILQRGLAELLTERMLIIGKNPALESNQTSEPRLRDINKEIETYRAEIQTLTTEIMTEGTFVGFLESERGNVAGRVSELKRAILEQTIQINQLEAQEAFIKGRLREFNRQFERVPENMIALARLQRDMQVNQGVFMTLSTQQTELMLLEQTQMGNGRVFDYAVTPSNPFYPRIPIILLIGVMLGFGSTAGIVTLLMLLNKKINSIDRLKSYDPTVLAVVPEMNTLINEQFKGNQFFMAGDKKISTSLIGLVDPVSHVSEAYRRLFNNIRFSNPDDETNVLVVTSATKGEGKTTCISNLAIAIAESGNRVLVMDCDYRRPRVHRLFDLSKEPGSSNHLFNETELDQLIQSSIVPGVDILTSGTEPPSPGLAINSEKMRKLVKKLSEEYDYVLIDTPPYGIITDAAPLIKMSDGVIVVTRFDVSTTPELDQLLENLNNISANVIGTVLMDYDPEVASGYYSYNKMYAYNYTVYKSYQEAGES